MINKVSNIRELVEPIYKNLPIDLLCLDKYQRDLSEDRVEKIAKNYKPRRMHPIDVSYRDGQYYVVDGQHRVYALKKINKSEVMCRIHTGLTYEEEADMFDELNKDRVGLSAIARFNSYIEAKKPEALDIVRIIKKNNFILGKDCGKAVDKIIAISTIQVIYKNLGADGLDRLLKIIKNAWFGILEAVDKRVLLGVYLFMKKYNGEFNDKDLENALSRTLPKSIIIEGKSMPEFPGAYSYTPYGLIVWKYYNMSKREANKLPNKF